MKHNLHALFIDGVEELFGSKKERGTVENFLDFKGKVLSYKCSSYGRAFTLIVHPEKPEEKGVFTILLYRGHISNGKGAAEILKIIWHDHSDGKKSALEKEILPPGRDCEAITKTIASIESLFFYANKKAIQKSKR